MDKVNVLMFLYNRPEHTAKTLSEVLRQKEHINKIFFFYDGPSNDKDANLQLEVKDVVRNLVNGYELESKDFVEIVNEENKGIAKSITSATNWYSKRFKLPFVVIEDDCVPRSHFFEFMRNSLSKFKDHQYVYTVCGYQYVEDRETESLKAELTTRFNPWGWGSWPEKWDFEWMQSKLNEHQMTYLPASVQHLVSDERFYTGEMDIWSVTVVIKQYLEKMLTVVPNLSLIENIGFDGTGVHSDKTSAFKIYKEKNLDELEISNEEIKLNGHRETQVENKLNENISKVMYKKV